MTAKAYKTKMAEPVVRKLKQLVETVLVAAALRGGGTVS